MYPKCSAKPLTGWLQMRCYMSLYLNGLQAVKVGGQKKAEILGSMLHFSRFYVVTSTAQVRYLARADFEGLQLSIPFSQKDIWYHFRNL